ncbi:MAG: carbohydrate porin, partial [Cyanobacteria bacterium J06635_10]
MYINAIHSKIAATPRLQSEFSAELATLRGRVDAVEARTPELEANQFSTTTKLEGEVVLGITDVFEGDTNDDNTTLGARTEIEFVTSFTGKDT